MKIEKIQLINPPLDVGTRGAGNSGLFPPLGLLYLGTYLKQEYPGKQVEVIDGGITSMKKVKIDGDLVGIGSLMSTSYNAMKIAKEAKGKGAYVILGGEQGKTRSNIILEKDGNIDSVCNSNQGWETIIPLVEYLEGRANVSEVPGLVYIKNRKIESNPSRYSFEDRKLIANRNLVDTEKYSENYMKIFGHLHDKKVIPATTQMMKGCGWGSKGGCIFCGITDIKPEHVDLNLAIKEYGNLRRIGVNYIYDIGDDVFSQTNFLRDLANSDVKINFVYGRASGVNDKSIELLKNLGVKGINMGIESGNDRMLKSLGKNNHEGIETVRNAAKILKKNGIELYTSFVLNAPGETESSLKNSVNLFGEISEYGNVVATDISALVPTIGSRAWNMMMQNKKYRGKYLNEHLIKSEELAKDWVEFACPDINYNHTREAVENMCNTARNKGIVIGGYGIVI